MKKNTAASTALLRRAATIARRYPGVRKPARVAECSGTCLCRKEARAALRKA